MHTSCTNSYQSCTRKAVKNGNPTGKKQTNIRDEVASAGKFHVPAYFAAPIMFNAALVKNAVFVLFRSREDVQRDIPGFLDDKETSFA